METVGLGDVVEKFTKATGIKKVADLIPGGCGCEQRKKPLMEYKCQKYYKWKKLMKV